MTEKEINQPHCQEVTEWSSKGIREPTQPNKHGGNSFPLMFGLNRK